MKKIKLSFAAILIAIICFGFTTPEKTADKIVESINANDPSALSKMYLTMEQFIDITAMMDPAPPQNEIDNFKKSYASKKEEYLASFSSSIRSINAEKIKIESLEYEYMIPKPGPDDFISWPKAKNYTPSDSVFTAISIKINLKSDKSTYLMSVDMVHYKGEFKFLNIMALPSISKTSE